MTATTCLTWQVIGFGFMDFLAHNGLLVFLVLLPTTIGVQWLRYRPVLRTAQRLNSKALRRLKAEHPSAPTQIEPARAQIAAPARRPRPAHRVASTLAPTAVIDPKSLIYVSCCLIALFIGLPLSEVSHASPRLLPCNHDCPTRTLFLLTSRCLLTPYALTPN